MKSKSRLLFPIILNSSGASSIKIRNVKLNRVKLSSFHSHYANPSKVVHNHHLQRYNITVLYVFLDLA